MTYEIKEGDMVTWMSQAMGSWTTKDGKIILVVPAKADPYGMIPESIRRECRSQFDGSPRDHESYIIRIKNKLYWPRVKGLREFRG